MATKNISDSGRVAGIDTTHGKGFAASPPTAASIKEVTTSSEAVRVTHHL
jgi:hypothetical protein